MRALTAARCTVMNSEMCKKGGADGQDVEKGLGVDCVLGEGLGG
jgi:hypothetical protein